MRKCPFCEKIVGNDPHIYFCDKKITSDKREIKYLFISKNFPDISNKEILLDMYVTRLKSLVDIKNTYGIDFKSTIFLLDYFNIEKRNISQSSIKISQNKYKKTCMDKYGVDNVSKSEKIKSKKAKTFLKNYGVDNIFKDSEFKKWILENNFAWNTPSTEENEERVKKQTISIKKYWHKLTDEQKNKIMHYNGTSNLETIISESLNYLSIGYTTQYPMKGRLFDFKVNNTNILIEVNGDYWHCNPLKYKIDEIVKFPGKEIKVSKIWEKDDKKRKIAEENGYKVVYIWENEIKESKDINQLVLQKLLT